MIRARVHGCAMPMHAACIRHECGGIIRHNAANRPNRMTECGGRAGRAPGPGRAAPDKLSLSTSNSVTGQLPVDSVRQLDSPTRRLADSPFKGRSRIGTERARRVRIRIRGAGPPPHHKVSHSESLLNDDDATCNQNSFTANTDPNNEPRVPIPPLTLRVPWPAPGPSPSSWPPRPPRGGPPSRRAS